MLGRLDRWNTESGGMELSNLAEESRCFEPRVGDTLPSSPTKNSADIHPRTVTFGKFSEWLDEPGGLHLRTFITRTPPKRKIKRLLRDA